MHAEEAHLNEKILNYVKPESTFDSYPFDPISQSATLAPHSASRLAMPYPMPDAAPVTKAVFPDKSIMQTSHFLHV